jgi:hypothetical protein
MTGVIGVQHPPQHRVTVTTGSGTLATHDVAINEVSGRLYRVGGGSSSTRGLKIYSLADPAAPSLLGEWNGRYCHDAQVATWAEGPYDGVAVAFCPWTGSDPLTSNLPWRGVIGPRTEKGLLSPTRWPSFARLGFNCSGSCTGSSPTR